MDCVRFATIESITIYDHVPAVLVFLQVSAGLQEQTWRLNKSLLDNRKILEDIQHKLEYFQINTVGEISYQTAWGSA